MSTIKPEETIKNHMVTKKFFKEILKPDKTPISKFEILMILNEEDGMRIGQLATKVDITRPNLTPLINILEKEGNILKIKEEEDNRAFIIKITEKGRKTYQENLSCIEKRLMNINQDITDEDKIIVNESFKTIINILQKRA